jgi:hypothetical protein
VSCYSVVAAGVKSVTVVLESDGLQARRGDPDIDLRSSSVQGVFDQFNEEALIVVSRPVLDGLGTMSHGASLLRVDVYITKLRETLRCVLSD